MGNIRNSEEYRAFVVRHSLTWDEIMESVGPARYGNRKSVNVGGTQRRRALLAVARILKLIAQEE